MILNKKKSYEVSLVNFCGNHVYDNVPRETYVWQLPRNIFDDQGLQTQVPHNQKSPTDFSMRDNGWLKKQHPKNS